MGSPNTVLTLPVEPRTSPTSYRISEAFIECTPLLAQRDEQLTGRGERPIDNRPLVDNLPHRGQEKKTRQVVTVSACVTTEARMLPARRKANP